MHRAGPDADSSFDRREHVAQAAVRVIARTGFEGASLRTIAREAGCTTGVLTHWFRNKEELILFSLDRVFHRLDEDVRAALARGLGPLETLRTVLTDVLPVAADRRALWRLWLHCASQALTHRAVAAEHAKRYGAIRRSIAGVIRSAQAGGEAFPKLDPDVEAERLVAVVDGVATHALLEPKAFPQARQVAVVERAIDALRAR